MSSRNTSFKFNVIGWLTGRIQKEDNDTKVVFLHLCCRYWQSKCEMSIAEAELECGEEKLKLLIENKIIKQNDGNINIKFLDVQFVKKEVKSKGKTFVAPTMQEVEDYFIQNGYTKESAQVAFKYYNVADWVDSKSNKIKNWKQKMQGVWFKDVNKVVVVAEKSECFKSCFAVYDNFIFSRTSIHSNISKKGEISLDNIIAQLRTSEKVRKDNDVILALQFIFINIDCWEDFHRTQIELEQIDANLKAIMSAIKNGKRKPMKSDRDVRIEGVRNLKEEAMKRIQQNNN